MIHHTASDLAVTRRRFLFVFLRWNNYRENLSDNKGSSLSVLRVCKRVKVGKAVKKLKNHELLFEEGVPGEVDVSDR